MYVARNKDGILAMYVHKPHKDEKKGRWIPMKKTQSEYIGLPWTWLENVKWEDVEPTKVEFIKK